MKNNYRIIILPEAQKDIRERKMDKL